MAFATGYHSWTTLPCMRSGQDCSRVARFSDNSKWRTLTEQRLYDLCKTGHPRKFNRTNVGKWNNQRGVEEGYTWCKLWHRYSDESVQTIYEMLRSQTLCRVQGRGDCAEENEEKEETASIQSFQLMVVHARWCECCSRVTCQSCLPEKNSFQAG